MNNSVLTNVGIDIGERVATLSMKQDRLLCAAALRLNIPPSYDKYMEWGFFDGSVRFYSADSRRVRKSSHWFLECPVRSTAANKPLATGSL